MPAGPDMTPYHDRQPVILGRMQYKAWLDPKASIDPLLASLPAGILGITRAE